MRSRNLDKYFCGLALLLAMGSAIRFGGGTHTVEMNRGSSRRAAPYYPADIKGPEIAPVLWPAPVALQRDGAWNYDVFTPPTVFYNESINQFTVVSTRKELTTVAAETPVPGLELVTVRPAHFRLQLVGYIGGEGNYAGAFENVRTGETYLARAGRSIPELGLQIESFAVARQAVPIPESMTSHESVATAVVRDTASGEVTVLTNLTRAPTGDGRAVLRLGGDQPVMQEATESEVIQHGGTRYKIEKIRLAPPAVIVSQLAADGAIAERRTLVPALPLTPETRVPLHHP